jgi:hypothetical protein
MNNNFDMAVAWRIYPKVSKQPILFADNKFKMVEHSLHSFIASTRGINVFIYFLLDGCPPEYKLMIGELFDAKNIQIIETNSIGNAATFQKQIEILLEQDKSEIIYFAEDDYIYAPDGFPQAVELLKNNSQVDFVSGYLPNDIFTHPIHQHKRNVLYHENKIWITANSSCLTFMTTRNVLRTTRDLFLTYVNGNRDTSIWLIITGTYVYNPLSYLKFINDKECFSILKMAIKYSFKYFFTTKKYQLWMPYPAICTHLETGNESPGTDWIALSKNVKYAQ